MKTLDDDIRNTLRVAAEHAAPEGYYDELAEQVGARLESEVQMRGVDMSGANGTGDRSQQPPPMGAGAASRTTAANDDSGLIDIKNMARTTKSRVTARHSTASDVEESLLASSRPSALRDVVLPEPGKEQPVTLAAAAATAVEGDADEVAAEPKRSSWLVAAAALVLLGGGGVAFFALRGGGDADQDTRVAASAASAERGAAAQPSMASADEPPAAPGEPGAIADDDDGDEATAADDSAGAATDDEGAADDEAAAADDDANADRKSEPRRATSGSKAVATKSRDDAASKQASGDSKVVAKADTSKKDDEPKKADKPKGQDLDSLLDFAAGEEAKKKDDVASKQAERKVTAKTKLSRSDVQQGMRALTARVGACYERFKVPGTVKVKVTIANTGVVTESTATGSFANTDTGSCVAKAVSQANFPEFSGPSMSLTYPFLLQ